MNRSFAFRPWVRSTCRRAMLWGLGVLGLLGFSVWLLRSPEEATMVRAFEVLLLYGLLFWMTLFKIWWTAGLPAVVLEEEALAYQPLHTFRPRRLPYQRILTCAPRPGSESLGFVVEDPPRVREFFLNLAVVQERHTLMQKLGDRLTAAGLEERPGREGGWQRPAG